MLSDNIVFKYLTKIDKKKRAKKLFNPRQVSELVVSTFSINLKSQTCDIGELKSLKRTYLDCVLSVRALCYTLFFKTIVLLKKTFGLSLISNPISLTLSIIKSKDFFETWNLGSIINSCPLGFTIDFNSLNNLS